MKACIALLGGAALLWAGCEQKKASTTPGPLPVPPLVVACEPGKPGGELLFSIPSPPRTYNPVFSTDVASDAVIRVMFRSLVTLDMATLQVTPGLAHHWEVAPDQKTWTFKLRQGLRWSDGVPLTAEDVAFTWNEVMYNPQNNQLAAGLFSVDGTNFTVTSVDPQTVRVVTPGVYAPLLEFFGIVPILPKHALAGAVSQGKFAQTLGLNTPPERLPVSGPFRLKELKPGVSVTLERNPEFWAVDKAGNRLPYLDRLVFNVTGPSTELSAFMKNSSDVIEGLRAEFAPAMIQIATNSGARVVELGITSEREFLCFNQNTNVVNGKPLVEPHKLAWFRDKRFRQAVSHAIDRDRIAREIYQNRARPVYGFISQENPRWFNPNIPKFDYDPAKARALLAELGLTDRDKDGMVEDAEGRKVEFQLCSNQGNPLREATARQVVENLKTVGVKANFVAEEFMALIERVNTSFNYECSLMGLGGGGLDPASQVNVLLSNSDLHQWFPLQTKPSTEWEAKVDELTLKQMRTLDQAERKKSFDEVQMILAEQLPLIYTTSPLGLGIIRSDVMNLRPSVHAAYRLTWNIEELWRTPAAAPR